LDADSVVRYLQENPQFFEEQAELLAKVRLSSPLGGRTLSLQERQMVLLRDKLKALELQLDGLMRIGHENDALIGKFQDWTRPLLAARNDVDLPHALVDGLRTIFGVPHATLRIWGVAEEYSHAWFSAAVSDDVRLFANGLGAPYCGRNNDFEVVSWLDEAPPPSSVAILPLRAPGAAGAFGLLVMGSPEPERFTAEMATDFLVRIADTSSAALACLLA
jgi:uncharacterized protein YigA (DUF484 family)